MSYAQLRPTALVAVGFFSLLIVSAGCQGQKYELIPVKGIIKINGVPASNVQVQVMPDIMEKNSGPTSQGVSGANGEFELATTDGKPGAVVGKHIAVFFDLDEDRPEQGEPSKRPARFPSQFSTAAGGLKIEIQSGKPLDLNIRTN